MTVPLDGYDAWYADFNIEANPYEEWDGRREEWDRDWMDADKNYKEEGRHRQ
jgi:hypothetical protein